MPERAPLRELNLASRGDRVRALVSGPDGDAPLVFLLGPDGSAESAWVEQLREVCPADWCTASVDLPLCGSRHSPKLSDAAFDPGHRLAPRLWPGLERQAAEDLSRLREALGSGRLVGLIAREHGADLALGWCARGARLEAVALISSEPARARSALGPRGETARVWSCDEQPSPGELVGLLRSRLGSAELERQQRS